MPGGILLRFLRFALAAALAALLLSRPNAAALGALDAMLCWATAVAPAMFPFMALLPALTGPEAARAYALLLGRPMTRLYRLPGGAAAALAAGMIGGSPAGALAARRAEGLTRGQRKRLALSACGMSPAFLVGGVGVGMLRSAAAGRLLLRSQAAVQLLLPLLLRSAWKGEGGPVEALSPLREAPPLRAAVGAILTVCGWMTLFGAAGRALQAWVGKGIAVPLLCLADVTAGCRQVAVMKCDFILKLSLTAALCGFGGGCIAAQNLAILRDAGVRIREYLCVRALAAALMALFTALQLAAKCEGFAPTGLSPFQLAAACAVLLALPATVASIRTRN